MTFKVTYQRDGHPVVHHGMTRADAQALADYVARTFRVEVKVEREGR